MSDEGEADALLDDRPELRDALEAVTAVDKQHDTWTFDDVPIDSGPFGELVSRGIVESVGDEYKLANPNATAAALSGESESEKRSFNFDSQLSGFELRPVDRTAVVALTVAIAFVGFVRAHTMNQIYRNSDIVLSGNDPYYYRYWVERVLAEGTSVLNFDALVALPDGITNGEPLLVATLWWLSELLGDGAAVVGDVMAWYPVISAVLTGLFVYLLAVTVTGDKRVGLAAVLLFAIVPGHALRTSLGFADHHAFDYLWLAVTAFTLTFLAGTDRDQLTAPRSLIASIFLGFAIAGQTLAWDASPILIAATGLAVVITALAAVETDRSPFITAVPTLVGLALGAGLTGAGHTVVGWHTARVAFAPTLVLGGSVLALGVAELVYRTTSDVRHLAVIDAVLFPIGIAVFRAHRPDDWNALASGTGRLTAERGIAETVGLFDPDSLGFVLLLGFTLVIALPAMVMGFQRARANPQWAVPTAYIWYFFGLSALSVRFVGEFALILAVFAGVGFVRLAAWIDVVKPLNFDVGRTAVKRLSVPDRQTFGVLVLLFLLVGSLGIVQVPVKTSQLTIEDSTYQSAAYIANHSDELNQSYPENYVLSQWGRNRVYNYFVNGQSESYGYARQTYAEFVRSPSADEWYDQFRGRVGYVVLESSVNSTTETAYAHLVNGYGSRTTRSDGVSHFRALYASPDGQKITYQVVPGANLTGQIEPNATVTVRTNVTIPGASFTYERQTTTDARGNYNVRVANPGTYVVRTDNETRETTVTAQSVRNGTRIQVDPA